MTIHTDERRDAARVALHTPVKLMLLAGLVLHARTLNISAKGVAIATDGPISLGTYLALRYCLSANGAPTELAAQARVIHSGFDSAGKCFVIGLAFSSSSSVVAGFVAASLAAA